MLDQFAREIFLICLTYLLSAFEQNENFIAISSRCVVTKYLFQSLLNVVYFPVFYFELKFFICLRIVCMEISSFLCELLHGQKDP